MKTASLYIIILVFCCQFSYGQTLKGIIKNASRERVPQAFIFTPSGNIHTHSDIQGFFSLKGLHEGDTIQISFLGYNTLQKIIEPGDFDEIQEFLMEDKFFELDQVNISNSLRTTSQIASIDLQTSPVRSSQEILTRVPGLFIAQHAGGGKAEQIFLRGFDIDHGTDIAIGVDGIPVNMVSHAHGQGYADLHFLIPETIDNIDFGKGPYNAQKGNFATAGYVDFKTKDRLENSVFGIEYGAFNSRRILSMVDLSGNQEQHNFYIASEYLGSDGPFRSPQNFKRLNVMAKYSHNFNNNDRISILASRFNSDWDASGQIPQRLVDQGTISRFGAVDDTEGGQTGRTNLLADFTKIISEQSFVKTRIFYSKYDFELFSNFTFFLEYPELGDQIKQHESRSMYGFESVLYNTHFHGNTGREIQVGAGVRYDEINDNELSYTQNRQTINERISLGNVDETNMYGFAKVDYSYQNWLFNLAGRIDYFKFSYQDDLSPVYTRMSKDIVILSPKANIIYNPGPSFQLFLKTGIGFHSNDSRVVLNEEAKEILPAAYGVDFGTVLKPTRRVWVNGALWYLFLDQEFVYVGDAGIVEPSGKSRRQGIELGLRYQLSDYIFLNTDVSYTMARSVDGEDGYNYIPLAPDLLATGSFTYLNPSGFGGGIQYRYIKDRPANEDFSIAARGYFLMNATMNYSFKNLTLGLKLENVLDTEWNESQFATESRLATELQSVEELHFTPGNPRNIRVSLQYAF